MWQLTDPIILRLLFIDYIYDFETLTLFGLLLNKSDEYSLDLKFSFSVILLKDLPKLIKKAFLRRKTKNCSRETPAKPFD